MSFYWPYFDLNAAGRLVDTDTGAILVKYDHGKPVPLFRTSAEAEGFLESNDLRGSVR